MSESERRADRIWADDRPLFSPRAVRDLLIASRTLTDALAAQVVRQREELERLKAR